MLGLINHYQDATGAIPCVGLWQQTLHQDLLWMRTGELRRTKADSVHPLNIPSWSWLSCLASVAFDPFNSPLETEQLDSIDHVTVVDCKIIWEAEAFKSDIRSTQLVLNGLVNEVFIEVAPEPVAQMSNPPYCNINHESPDFSKDPLPWPCMAQFDREHRIPRNTWTCVLLRSTTHPEKG